MTVHFRHRIGNLNPEAELATSWSRRPLETDDVLYEQCALIIKYNYYYDIQFVFSAIDLVDITHFCKC